MDAIHHHQAGRGATGDRRGRVGHRPGQQRQCPLLRRGQPGRDPREFTDWVEVLVGGLLVVVFMIAYYKGAGLVAVVAVALNILYMQAALAGFQAVLTLPGIAGVVLTVGMAVDANVLINERIREELAAGKSMRLPADARAYRTAACPRQPASRACRHRTVCPASAA